MRAAGKLMVSVLALAAAFAAGIWTSAGEADGFKEKITAYFYPVTYYFDGKKDTSDPKVYKNNGNQVPKTITYQGTTYVPLRYVGEKLGKEVGYDGKTHSVWIGQKPKLEAVQANSVQRTASVTSSFKVEIGDRWNTVKSKLGSYKAAYTGANKTKWWVYDRYWIGFRDGHVIEMFSNTLDTQYNGVKVGSTRSEVEKKLKYSAKPEWALYGATFTFKNDSSEKVLYKSGSLAIIAYYDNLDKKKLLGLRVVNPTELVHKKYFGYTYQYIKKPNIPSYPTDTATVNRDAARQVLWLTNIERAKKKVPALAWSDQAAASAYKHSKDMSVYNYFSHTTRAGKSPFDLMAEQGIKYTLAAENISMGYPDAIEAVFGWMNSSGHRKNLLNPAFKKLGVGVYGTYYTQHFFTP
ncbi:CAP domain-containing protein [Aneurinibacillus thermoaerophilus]|uniref:CAP domain-containing protein n=1 Tax=Aneurinibacillus thermoaerophilus TaxID=143495 RepID=UPI002E1F9024|nr:CAP domain-containing protein [Aneurinibacillus thermoaerophilus]